MSRRGLFVTLEGVDGCGKTTQSRRLAGALGALHVTAVSDGPLGRLARDYLRGEREFPGNDAFQLLLAADRVSQSPSITEALDAGRHVVADRWSLSGYVYGAHERSMRTRAPMSVARPLWHEWFAAVDAQCVAPDLYVVLDVDPDEAARRMVGRPGATRDRYEGENKLRAAMAEYRWWSGRRLRNAPVCFLDASGDADAVAAALLERVTAEHSAR